MRISDWSSDVCSSDLLALLRGPTARAAVAPAREVSTQVAVLGGGVGGLTVAQELAERGLQVTVFEPKALGGKARSIPVPGTGQGGRADLPGEHGFRFFPGFYKNTTDTDRKSVVAGKSVDERVDLGGRRIIKNKKKKKLRT